MDNMGVFFKHIGHTSLDVNIRATYTESFCNNGIKIDVAYQHIQNDDLGWQLPIRD